MMPTLSPEREQVTRTLFQQSSFVFLVQIATLVSGILSTYLVSLMGGPEGKGYIYTLQLLSGIALILANFGIGPAAVYHFRRDDGYTVEEITAGLLWPSLLLGCVPLLLLAVLHQAPIAFLKNGIWGSTATIAFSVVPAYTLLWNLSYLYLAKGEIGGYNILRAAQQTLLAALLLGLLFLHVTALRTLVILWAASVWAPALVAMAIAGGSGAIWKLPNRRFVRHAFAFGWRSHLGAVVQYLQHRADVVLVLYFLPLRELGIYSLAIGLAELLWYVPQSVSQVLMPHVASSKRADADLITSAFCRASFTTTAVLSLALALVCTVVIPLLLPAFRPAVPLIWILLPGTVVASVFKVLASDLNGRGQPLKTLFPAATALAFSIAGCCYAIPRFGTTGAATVTSLAYILNASLYIHGFSRSPTVSARSLLLLRARDLHWCRKLLFSGRRG